MRIRFGIFFLILASSSIEPIFSQVNNDCDNAKRIISNASQLNDIEDKIREYRNAVNLCPNVDIPHFRLALAFEEQQDKEDVENPDYSTAVYEYRETLRINPDHYGAYFQLAGIYYVTSRFDLAASHYQKFIELDNDPSKHKEMQEAAKRLIIKCNWLSLLPKNSIKNVTLRQDPDRYAGVSLLIGEIAYELGKAATNVTGKLGYEAAGIAIFWGSKFFSEKKVNLNYLYKAFYESDYEKLYTKSLEILPEVINKKGINSDKVYLILNWIYFGGKNIENYDKPSKDFLLPFVHAITIRDIPQALFTKYKIISVIKASAHIYLSDSYPRDELFYTEISNNFQKASILYNKFVNHENVNLSDSTKNLYLGAQFVTEIKSNIFGSFNYENEFYNLQKAIDSYYKLKSNPELFKEKSFENNIGLIFRVIANMHYNESASFELFSRYRDFAHSIIQRRDLSLIEYHILLGWANILYSWGEHKQAIRIIEGIESDEIKNNNDLVYQKGVYNIFFHTDYFDKVKQYVYNISSTLPLNKQYNSRFKLALYLINNLEIERATDALDSCIVFIKNHSEFQEEIIETPEILKLALIDDSQNLKNKNWNRLFNSLENLSISNWNKFEKNIFKILNNIYFNFNTKSKTKNFVDRILQICRANENCTKEIQHKIILQYYKQVGDYLPLVEDILKQNDNIWDSNPDSLYLRSYLFDSNKSRLAIYYHELKDYENSIRIRKELLKKLEKYIDLFPETIADIKTRIAESLSAKGDILEAKKLLRESIITFEYFETSGLCDREKRAKIAFVKLLSGNNDIAPHDRNALRFFR